MGVDVVGIKPKADCGEWVGYNSLIWGALWDLCINITPLLRKAENDWEHGGGAKFEIKGDEHKLLKQKLKSLLGKPDINRNYREYLNYLEKHDEHREAMKVCREFYKFIINNEGFEVS
jgi:hypothetical protein